ncbi:alpha/beta hydrolase family protein [Sandaracinus amylolyticus]|uniref:Peptidase S9 prolyl oligopeptidase catalytic domain-containing protein n=1 Tax=Sandaracinus amylolyticus TaxID=927083 RepID=A0A0F6SDP2_9BACT|nr:S9 family peptidase [Sandaracinus amylolyticus]AKF03789.1 hypothetical protein DB32_000938 [Sandaracinus amylolyticus]
MRALLFLALLALLTSCGARTTTMTTPPPEPTSTPPTTETAGPPRPEDVPRVGSVHVGLAGASEPDVVRYLLVRTAYAGRLAPDGSWLSFRSSITGEPQLWTVDADGGWPEQRTFGQSVTFHAVSPAGDWIAYGTDRAGNEREGFYLVRPDGTHERELLPPSESFRAFGGFSRDGSKIAYATTDGSSDRFAIRVVDLASGADREVHAGGVGYYVAAWRPDGGALVIGEIRGEDANDLHQLDLATGELTTLFAPREEPSTYQSIEWLPDSSGFYLVSDQGRDFAALAFVDARTRALSFVETPSHDVEQVALSHDGRVLAWTENTGGRSTLQVRDRRTSRAIPIPPDLPPGTYRIAFAEHADVMSIDVSSPRVPGDVWIWDLRDRSLRRATRSTLAGIDATTLVEPEHVDLPARDGETIHGLLYLPPGERSAPPPVLLNVHGGPTAQARPSFSAVQQYLLARGIAIFDLNFRGSTGYGKRYARLDNQRLRPNAVNDMADTLDWLARSGRVDASRAAVMGGSYGGFMTFAALVHFPDRFRAGVSFVGVSDWVTALEGASPQLRASDRLEYGDIDDPGDREFFVQLSPITHIARMRAPLLVEHGANDPRDPVSESDRFVRAARAQDVEVEYLRFPDEGHGVRQLRNRVHMYRQIAAFLERHLR